jgi:DNA-3-methyladenine glycosylase I
MKRRCAWVNPDNPLYVAYHDREWGVPVHDDRRLFEMLCLEGAQAGLSWETVLNKREGYRRAFRGFDPVRLSRMSEARMEKLMHDPGIVRNRLKIRSVRENARAYLRLRREFGSLDAYLWAFVGGEPIRRRSRGKLPARTPLSDRLSRDLKKRGFRFVGSTICYAFLQAVGLVDDHAPGCFRARARPGRRRP